MITIEFPNDFVKRIENLKVGPNNYTATDPTGYFYFDTRQLQDDGTMYIRFGTTNYGSIYGFAVSREALQQIARAFAQNARSISEHFKPTTLVLTPLFGGEIVRVEAAALRLEGADYVVESADGNERRFSVLEYTVGTAIDKPKNDVPAVAPPADDEDDEPEDEDEDE